MAFIPSASTVTLTAKLTPFGRQQLLQNTNSVISHFSLGDSDANYRVTDALDYGQIPVPSGQISVDNTLSNSVTVGASIRSKILVNSQGLTTKEVESTSNQITTTQKNIGVSTTLSADTNFFIIDKNNYASDSLTNLFHTFGLPITNQEKTLYTSIIDTYGGFADTALSNLNQDKVLVISINSDKYGELIDGRVLKIEMTVSGAPYTIYSTYQKSLTPLTIQDAKTIENSQKSKIIGDNIVFLFSDEIKRPNNNLFKSWATGFNTVKPFSANNKELFNLVTNTSNNSYADKAIGVAYLDKGLIVITEPEIVNNIQIDDEVTITLDSLIHEVSQDITCVVNRGEFSRSLNTTYSAGDPIRISEVGLYDNQGNLMALAKTNKHVILGANQFLAIGVKISI